jgi:hypothetical protein
MTEPTISAWPGGTGTNILSSTKLEPSGLTVWTDGSTQWFYLASDNGKLARRNVDLSDDWQGVTFGTTKAYDFECITTVTGELMVGVEGARDDVPNPQIQRFDPSDTSQSAIGSFTGSVWNLVGLSLDNNSGMEGLTFIPDGQYPSSWGTSSHYGGLFLAAFQSYPGQIYVYDLPTGGGTSHDVRALLSFQTGQSTQKISDLCFSNGVLYVLYDDSTDTLEEMVLNTNKTAFTTRYITTTPYVGTEAITLLGPDLYLGLDQTSTQFTDNGLTTNLVTKYSNYTSSH